MQPVYDPVELSSHHIDHIRFPDWSEYHNCLAAQLINLIQNHGKISLAVSYQMDVFLYQND